MNVEEKKKQELGEKIIKSIQKRLYTKYPYMMMVIYNLIPLYDPKEETMSTDGKYIFYSPSYLIKNYKEKKIVQLEKMYMHMVLHCIFGHVIRRDEKDVDAYDALVDLNVTIAMGQLKEKGIRTPAKLMASKEMKTIQNIWKDKLNEEMYEEMMKKPKIRRLVESFSEYTTQDNHTYWTKMNPVAKQEEERNKRNESGNKGNKSDNKGNQSGNKSKTSGMGIEVKVYQKEIQEQWNRIRNMILSEGTMENKNMFGMLAGTLSAEERERYGMAEENRCSYKEFLRRFVENQEVMKIDEDTFDYIWYHIGTQMYENVPILEPLEYKDDKVCDNFVIAIDTSGSCSGEISERFLRETWNLFRDMSAKDRTFRIYLMQCDMKITYEKELQREEDIPDFDDMEMFGFGGTSFCPVFERIEELRESGRFPKVNGLIYFSDGFGDFPKKATEYETIFVLPPQEDLFGESFEPDIPSWITKIQLTEDDLKIDE